MADYIHKTTFLKLIWILVLGIQGISQTKINCDQENEEYMVVFSDPNSLKDAGGIERISMSDRFHIQGESGTLLEINTKKYEIPSSGYLIIEDKFPQVPYEYSVGNTIKIKTNASISINAERVSPYSVSGFTLVPVSKWGKQYTIPGYQDQSMKYKINNFIDIIAYEKKTNVTIKDPQGKAVKKISLTSGQNYEYNNTDDLTGYTVESTKNVGVLSGNHCLRISAACDHTVLMLSDNTRLSSKYYNPGSSFFTSSTIHRLVATHNNTRIKIEGKQEIKLNKNEFYEYRNEKPHIIESSSPILAYSLFDKRSLSSPENSVDPSFYFIPSVDQAINSVKFSFPEHMIYSKDIRIIMKTNKIKSLLVDGYIPDVEWGNFPYDPLVSYTTLSFFDQSIHSLSVSDSEAYFIPLMMARGWDVSLGTTLKTGFTNLITGKNPPCPDRKSTILTSEPIIHSNPLGEIARKEIILNDIRKPITVEKEEIDLLIFDNAEEDGDIISLYLNDQLVYSNVSVLKAGTTLRFKLENGKNIITIKAENEGSIYPNTAGLTFDDGTTLQTIILHNKKGQSKNLTIISK